MDRSYQCHTCLRPFSRSDSLRRHLESGICKQNEDHEENQTPSEKSESQQDEDDSSSSEEDELPQSQTEMTKSAPWDRLMETVYDTFIQDTFDETWETYLN